MRFVSRDSSSQAAPSTAEDGDDTRFVVDALLAETENVALQTASAFGAGGST